MPVRIRKTVNKTGRNRRYFLPLSLLISALTLSSFLILQLFRSHLEALQIHNDPRVGRIWLTGESFGANPSLRSHDPLQFLLNKLGLGQQTLLSRFYGASGGMELWFGYHSKIPGSPHLICHRVGRTAFSDNLGQDYHGFLDIQPNNFIGVYLPGYDHKAHRLICTLHWMPSDGPGPVSRPMQFIINLPPAIRLLPYSNQLPANSASRTVDGVSAALSRVQLSEPNYSEYRQYQRVLSFNLSVKGGKLEASNTIMVASQMPDPFSPPALRSKTAPGKAAQHPLSISDPYGISLMSPGELVLPLLSVNQEGPVKDVNGEIWMAQVDGAGESTDVVRFQFFVQKDHSGKLIYFDLLTPVEHDLKV